MRIIPGKREDTRGGDIFILRKSPRAKDCSLFEHMPKVPTRTNIAAMQHNTPPLHAGIPPIAITRRLHCTFYLIVIQVYQVGRFGLGDRSLSILRFRQGFEVLLRQIPHVFRAACEASTYLTPAAMTRGPVQRTSILMPWRTWGARAMMRIEAFLTEDWS